MRYFKLVTFYTRTSSSRAVDPSAEISPNAPSVDLTQLNIGDSAMQHFVEGACIEVAFGSTCVAKW